MRLTILALLLASLTACNKDESIAAFVPDGSVWHLTELGGEPFPARATLTFPEAGKIAGHAPCNTYGAGQTAPYPWFGIGPILATKMACETLALEQVFFTTLTTATFAEVSGDTLILSDDTGELLVFKSR